MSIPKKALEKAFNELISTYNSDDNEEDIKTFDELEKSGINFSNEMIKKAMEITLNDGTKAQKKTYVKSVERVLHQLGIEKKPS